MGTVVRKSAAELAQMSKESARRRIIERGKVEFRADEEMMDLLLHVADHRKMPIGVMVRSWVWERLRQEAKGLKS